MKISADEAKWVSEFIASRRSTRDFVKDKAVPQELIDQLLHDSLTAPSWSNTRPFKVAVATGDVRNKISEEFLSRWKALSKARNRGFLGKVKLDFSPEPAS